MASEKTRSVVVHNFGGYENVKVEDFPLPSLEENIEVAVEYGGINFADIYMRQGLRSAPPPYVMGIECTGKITAIGSKVSANNFKVGQRVICYNTDVGLYREKVRIDPKSCFPIPDYMDCKTACTVFINYLTAWFCLMELGHLRLNEKVLIQSCTGGVGVAATQIAKTIDGVKVYGTGSEQKRNRAVENGVDHFFTKEEFRSSVENERFDVIIASETGQLLNFLQGLLKPLGRIIIIGANNAIGEGSLNTSELSNSTPIPIESLILNNRVVAGLHLGFIADQEKVKLIGIFQTICEMIRDSKLSPVIDTVWPISKVTEANKRLSERKNVGKVLIHMKD